MKRENAEPPIIMNKENSQSLLHKQNVKTKRNIQANLQDLKMILTVEERNYHHHPSSSMDKIENHKRPEKSSNLQMETL